MGKLIGKIALITGGNSGMGYSTAELFIKEGAQVIITGRRKDAVEEATKKLGSGAFGITADVSNLQQLNQAFTKIREEFGRLDIVFANAGIGYFAPIGSVSEEHFDSQFNVNVKGLFFTVQNALPLLKDGSSIILNASIAASKGTEAFSVYSATKAAVRSFARSWTTDLKTRQIRVNVISPGPIETPIFGKTGLSETQIQEFGNSIVSQVPLGRMGRPEEVAHAALFLASSDSSYIAGIELTVDGGMAQV
jgi:NAD(P)-dependent dehydrogenase (short-subunit alcohol dehydrogenase family)